MTDEKDAEKVCCNCQHNVRCPQKRDLSKIECYCEIDNHFITYANCFTDCCEKWEGKVKSE